jgi:penicillin-binding protein 1A
VTDPNTPSYSGSEAPPNGEETFRADLPPGGGNGKGRGKGPRWLWILLAIFTVLLSAGAFAALAGWRHLERTYFVDLPEVPAREALYEMNRAPAIRFYDRNGVMLASRGPKHGDRVFVRQLPDHVRDAFLAAEDRRFFQHRGVDPIAIWRAWRANRAAGRVVEGGSTITQQLAKTLFLTPDQTMTRKIQEAELARRIEQRLSKDEILELYLNRIYFGANTFGIDGASRTYFDKPAAQLNLSEAALLAALPKAPSQLALHRNMKGALVRQRLVLQRMLREGWITEAEMAAAIANPPQLAATALADDGDIGYALDYATTEVLRLVGSESTDLDVWLTIDGKLQEQGGEVLRSVLQADGRTAGASQAAMVSISEEGAIRTLIGGVDYGESVFNRAVQARRQPGSSFKPLVYAAALEAGVLPSDVRVDEPLDIGGWKPRNYGGGHRGPVTVQAALAASINTISVKLAQEAGPTAIAGLARRFGITTVPADAQLSIALGAYEVPLIEMVSAYQVFQQQGLRLTPYIVEEIRTVRGEPVYRHATASPVPAYDIIRSSMMVRMMQSVITSGTGTGANIGRPAAGKTGTSQNWRDAWFIGFTPDIATGVWVGNDDDRPMNRVTGGELAARAWARYMTAAHAFLPPREFDWLLPEPEPEMEEDPRNWFYEGLADDFARIAGDAPAPPREPDFEPDLAIPPPPQGEDREP